MKEQENTEAVLRLVREFDAPIDVVFEANASAEGLAAWWGPQGFKMTVVKLDFEPQGICHYKMENEEMIMWARFIYREIIRPRYIEFALSFSDEEGGVTRAPFFDNWPLEILNQLSFSEKDGRTTISLTCSPINATPGEMDTFKANKSSFEQGTSAAFNQLKVYLEDNQKR